jgi:non-specific protein-tyrosine kinase
MELRQYISIGLKWWWLMVLLTVVAAATSFVVSQRQTPVYQASTTLIVGRTIQAVEVSAGDFLITERLAQTYADMARRQPILQAVVESLGLKGSWKALKGRVSVRPVKGTQLLAITVEAGSPEEARVTADEIAHQLILLSPTASQNQEQNENQHLIRQRLESLQAKIEAGQERLKALEIAMADSLSAQQVKELQGEINTLESLITDWENNYTQLLIFVASEKSPNYLAVIEPAQASSSPIRPRILQNTFLAGVVGLFLALGVIFLIEYLDDTFKSANDLSQTLGIVTLGTISRVSGKQYREKLIIAQNLFSPVSEAYRMMRSNIQFISVDQPIKSIMVTSSTPGEGKSITVANLGIVMAQADFKTIIVDADLRRPVQHEIFQVSNLGGVTEWLRSPELEIKTQLRNTSVENLQMITSGVLPPNPAELLSSQRMGQLLTNLNELADVVIYDCPPVLAVTDAAVLSNRVDGVVFVIKAGQTRREAARHAVLNLQQAGANVLGGVLNQVSQKSGYNQDYYYTPGRRPMTAMQTIHAIRRRWQWLPFIHDNGKSQIQEYYEKLFDK